TGGHCRYLPGAVRGRFAERQRVWTGDSVRPDAAVPLGTVPEDERHVGVRLDVVDVCRLIEDTGLGREGRLDFGHAALALGAGNEAGLLTADVAAGTPDQHNVMGEVEAEDP